MDVERLRAACLGLAGAYEDYPFGPEIAVFRVRVPGGAAPPGPGRIFALVRVEVEPLSISLKCDPALAVQLRSAHPEITPGYHMDKRHWISLHPGGSLGPDVVEELVTESYRLVVAGLPSAQRPVEPHAFGRGQR